MNNLVRIYSGNKEPKKTDLWKKEDGLYYFDEKEGWKAFKTKESSYPEDPLTIPVNTFFDVKAILDVNECVPITITGRALSVKSHKSELVNGRALLLRQEDFFDGSNYLPNSVILNLEATTELQYVSVYNREISMIDMIELNNIHSLDKLYKYLKTQNNNK